LLNRTIRRGIEMTAMAYINGRITTIKDAFVPIEDRGYQFGDAVYEFLATYDGVVFAMTEHLDRLARSMRMLDFPVVARSVFERAIDELLKQSGILRAGIYIQVSRGVAPRNHAFPGDLQPQIIITIRPAAEIPEQLRRSGIRAITVEDQRWGRCDIKTVQLLPNVMAKQKALDAGAQDAILIDTDGVVREGTSSNLFMAGQGQLYTHPLTERILPGITRALILGFCREEGVVVQETHFKREQLLQADEVFLTGTVTEVLPVVTIDGQTVGAGRPGPLSLRLQERLHQYAGHV
jgi:D-alanine transaminase